MKKNAGFPSGLWLLTVLLFVSACAGAQPPAKTGGATIKSQPIYEPCASLKAGTSAEDAVAKGIASLKEKDAKTRAQAAQGLAASCDDRAVDPLIDALKDPDAMVRAAAAESLGRLGRPDSAEDLINLMQDPDWRVRMALISPLASFKTFRPRNMVLNGIANPSGADIADPDDMRVRCAAILTCAQMRDVSYSRKAILFLYQFLKSRHESTRRLAEETMFELKNTRNGPSEFAAILKLSNDPELRRWAAEWIGKIGIDYARPALEEAAANDADPTVKQTAARALQAMKK
ncbi:MAG: HEAT repeat domain-containing protein [Blastocatellia bacterium]|nr:HEAT repeat domain-containing protein [Blastocatellia bacterium]